MGEVDDGVMATGDANTKLALGEEVGGKVGGGVFEDGRGKEAAPGEANAVGEKFGGVGGVLVEGGEVVALGGISKEGREGPVAEIALEFGVFGKVGASGGCSGVGGVGGSLKKAEEMNGIGVIGEGAGGGEFTDGAEAVEEVGISEGEGGSGVAVGGGHRGGRHGLEVAEVGGVKFVAVGELLGLAGGGRVNRGEGGVESESEVESVGEGVGESSGPSVGSLWKTVARGSLWVRGRWWELW
jgi:hypothetical protein